MPRPATASQFKVFNLNTKMGSTKILSLFKTVYDGKKCKDNVKCSYYFTKKEKKQEHIFDLNICKKKSKIQIDMTQNTKNGVCLKMSFTKQRPHPKMKSYYSFSNSKIELINRGVCGYSNGKKIKIISGSYVLNAANRLNDLLAVKVSKLEDDSRLDVCNSNVSLKMINLLKYGKTWYEREGGFKLNDKEIYKRAKIVGEMRVSELYNTLLEIDNNALKNSIMDFADRKINPEKIEKVSGLLSKMKMSKNSKIKNLIPKIFSRDSPYKECEQKFLWDFILGLGNRAHIKKSEKEQYKLIKEYYKLQTDMFLYSKSTRKK